MKNRVPASLSPDEAMNAAMEAYIYGFPLVLMDLTREVMTAAAAPTGHRAPINQLLHLRTFPDPTFTDVVSPNADTLYSTAWIDLSKQPMVLSVPAMNRFYTMQMLDAWTDVFASPGTRTTGNKKADFAIVGRAWNGKVPKGLTEIHSPTRFAWIVGRIQANGKDDFTAVNAIQDQYKLTPLHAWGKTYMPPKGKPFDAGIDVNTPPVDQVMKMEASRFLSRLNNAMNENRPAASDKAILEQLAPIGIAPGRAFDLNSFEWSVAEAMRNGVEAARAKILSEGRKSFGRNVNGWDILPGNTGNFGTDYNTRALVALNWLGANLPEDAIYPHTMIDTHGQPLNGKNSYVIRFHKGQLPPVNAFWSITAYNSQHFFIPNPIGRYAIGDRDKLKADADGSTTIHLSSVSPGPDKQSNWLPVGCDAFNLIMRLYWPKPDILNGTWRVPAVERLQA